MSIITSLNKQATNLARKALRLGNDFVHPVSDDSGNTPDYNDPNSILSPDGHIELPHTAEWGPVCGSSIWPSGERMLFGSL